MQHSRYVLGIIGSPRKNGNTDFIIDKIIKETVKNGAIGEKIYLNELNIKPCQGCEHCKKNKSCKIKDDFQKLIKKIELSDAIIIGSPIYFGTITAQMKTFIDRTFSLLDINFRSKIKDKRKGAVVLVWASTNKEYADRRNPTFQLLHSILEDIFKADVIGKITKGGLSNICDASKDKNILK